jgi:multiple sugar transport system permease protein
MIVAGVATVPASAARRRPWLTPDRREALIGYLFLLPWIVGFLGLTLGPMLFSLYASFTQYNIVSAPKWTGFYNYGLILKTDSDFRIALFDTFWYVIVRTPVHLVVALILALLLNLKLRGTNLFRTIFYSPTVLGGVSAIFLWIWILNPQGLINRGLGVFHIPGPNWFYDPTWSKPGLVIMSLWQIGGAMVIFLAGLNAIPRTLYEAGQIDGATGWTRFWRITLPLLSPSIFFLVVVNIIGGFQVFNQAYVVSTTTSANPGDPAKSLLFYEILIYLHAFKNLEMGYATALSWILFVIVMAITVFNLWLSRRWVYYED